MHSHRDGPIFSFAYVENIRGNVTGATSPEPRRIPEISGGTISNRNQSCRVEKVHIFLHAWVSQANPKFFRRFPLQPRPPQPQCSRKGMKVKHAQPSELFRTAYGLPVHFALPTRDGGGRRPKEGPLDFCNALKRSGRDGEGCDVVDNLGSGDGFDPRAAPSNREVLSRADRKPGSDLVLQKLKVRFPKTVGGERQAEVAQRKGVTGCWKVREHHVEVNTRTTNGNNRALEKISDQTRRLSKVSKNGSQDVYVGRNRLQKNHHIIGVNGSTKIGSSPLNSTQEPLIGGNVKQLLQRIDTDDEEQRREGVSLPQPPPMSDRASRHTIKENPRGS